MTMNRADIVQSKLRDIDEVWSIKKFFKKLKESLLDLGMAVVRGNYIRVPSSFLGTKMSSQGLVLDFGELDVLLKDDHTWTVYKNNESVNEVFGLGNKRPKANLRNLEKTLKGGIKDNVDAFIELLGSHIEIDIGLAPNIILTRTGWNIGEME